MTDLGDELEQWARHLAVLVDHQIAQVEGVGWGWDSAELRRWALTRPSWFVPNHRQVHRYRRWMQRAVHRLDGTRVLLAVNVPAGPWGTVPVGLASGALPEAEAAAASLVALFPTGWSFHDVDRAVARLIRALGGLSGLEPDHVRWCAGGSAQAVMIAATRVGEGIDVDQAMAEAVAAA